VDQLKQPITIDLEWVDHTQETVEESVVAPQLQVEQAVAPLMTRDNLQITHSMLRAQVCITPFILSVVGLRTTIVVHRLQELDHQPLEEMASLEDIKIRDLHQQIE